MLRRGEVLLSARELADLVAAAPVLATPGRVELIIDPSPIQALCRALAVRRRGGIALVGDPRWSTGFREALSAHIAAAGTLPAHLAWATSTSGSTGSPRVVLRTAQSWSSSFAALDDLLDVGAEDQILAASPLISSIALFAAIYALESSRGLILPAGAQLERADLRRATILHGTPQALRRALELLEAGAPSALRGAMIGGSRLDPELRERAERQGITVVSYYGAAELSFVAADSDGTGLRPFPGVHTEVRGEGELWVSSPFLAWGYLEPERSGGALRREDSAGVWMSVGDRVSRGPEGTLHIHGRADSAILTASATVIPEDVESILRTLPGIADAVVFALPTPRVGALIAAAIELTPGAAPPSLKDLTTAARAVLTSSHRPRRWYIAATLPRTLAGKIQRHGLESHIAATTPTTGEFHRVL